MYLLGDEVNDLWVRLGKKKENYPRIIINILSKYGIFCSDIEDNAPDKKR